MLNHIEENDRNRLIEWANAILTASQAAKAQSGEDQRASLATVEQNAQELKTFVTFGQNTPRPVTPVLGTANPIRPWKKPAPIYIRK